MPESLLQLPDPLRPGPWPVAAPRPQAAADDAAGVDPWADPPDPGLVQALRPVPLLRHGLLPWRRAGAVTIVLCADPAGAEPQRPWLEARLGPVRLARAEPGLLDLALAEVVGGPLAARAETLRPAADSCRSLPGLRLARATYWLAAVLLVWGVLAPLSLLATVAALAALSLLALAGLRLAAVLATLPADARDAGAEVVPARLPVVSVLVPLYEEEAVARTILRRVEALDYPAERLDLCLILEADDVVTCRALEAARIPPFAQVIRVPPGTLRTKPRALNYALPFAKGSILGIYDAEDIPAPDHLRQVAARFARRGPGVACLQGALDYFNWRRNWLARCFTLEYAAWFRVLLPGIARLGLAVPLGGTTLFVRREALEAVGGWDAHNVTEDADLGLLLARRGWRTEMIPIATEEEANARPWRWIRQRSRWLKGYAVTWAVHMRDPAALWRDLGPRAFWGVQVMFLGSLLHFALAPVLWSFWLVPLGVPHPLAALLPPAARLPLLGLFLLAQALDLACAGIGARLAGKPRLAPWALTLPLYFPLATLALYRALWEVATCPFHWDKTAHGFDLPPEEVTPPPAPSPHQAGGAS